MVNPLLVALDVADADEAMRLARLLSPVVSGFKAGLELLGSAGPEVVAEIASLGLPVFADIKLHDIPNTVRGAARSMGRQGARWVTAHASGGREMLVAAREGLAEGATGEAGVLAVTVLTSLDVTDLEAIGVHRSVDDQVAVLSDIAASAGVEGVVCAPAEAAQVKSRHPSLLAVTPGIRLDGHHHDQKRVATPLEAVRAGADYIVVGRSVTSAPDPTAIAMRILSDLAVSR